MLNDIKFSEIIPAYRVESHIAQLTENIPEFVQGIIVVNDANLDQNGNVFDSINETRLTVVTHSENRAVGGTMISGYDCAVVQDVSIPTRYQDEESSED